MKTGSPSRQLARATPQVSPHRTLRGQIGQPDVPSVRRPSTHRFAPRNAREVAKETEHEGWYALGASSYDGIVLRIEQGVRRKSGKLRSGRMTLDLLWAVSFSEEFFFSRSQQSGTKPPANHGRKTPHCAGSLMIIISGRLSCWLSRPAPSCWSSG